MMTIVGGTYRELSAEPFRDVLFGSGGRAAAALAELSPDVELITPLHPDQWPDLQALANASNFKASPYPSPQTVQFEYFHGLSRPEIVPPLHLMRRAETPTVTRDQILRFGLIEGDVQVRAGVAVYDPQDVVSPTGFRANGSHADRLAIVLNRGEGYRLTSHHDPEMIVTELAQAEHADVVILKMGASGALVYDRGDLTRVPAYKTNAVWPIGSGDVFSAVFAYHWMDGGLEAREAANRASVATAYYCSTQTLPIPTDISVQQFVPLQPDARDGKKPSVYLAGPFFTMGQRWVVGQAWVALRDMGMTVFSPYHDVGVGPAEHVVQHDIQGIENSDILFAIVDGLDAGTLFEIGYARALGKPVVVFMQNETDESMKMLKGTQCQIERDFVTAVYKAMWAALEA